VALRRESLLGEDRPEEIALHSSVEGVLRLPRKIALREGTLQERKGETSVQQQASI
jgi:hypothetical protein